MLQRPFHEELQGRLAELEGQDLDRRLMLPQGIDFTSNDYLGLSRHPKLRDGTLRRWSEETAIPFGAPASRLLRGTTAAHLALERRLAAFKGTESALIFSSGYVANIAVLTTLVQRHDRVLSDELNHASIIDGIRLARCEKVVYRHCDAGELERHLACQHPSGRTFVVTESLFSMDGDIAPLHQYAELTSRYGAELLVDDAHSVGIFGDQRGSGLVEHFGVTQQVSAIISTFGKALGLFGAFVGGPRTVIDYLINCARPFIYSTAPAPFFLSAVDAALDIVEDQPQLRARVRQLADRLRRRLTGHGIDCLNSAGPIVPVLIGENRRTLEVAESLRSRGFDVRAIRPPSVAPGSARLRISVHADHTEEQIDTLASTLAGLLGANAAAG